jgi:hypothetical protein
MNYYDAILGLIPVVLAGVAGGLLAIGFELTVATPLAALGAITLIGHAMFVNGPTDDPSQSTPAITAATDAPAMDIAD